MRAARLVGDMISADALVQLRGVRFAGARVARGARWQARAEGVSGAAGEELEVREVQAVGWRVQRDGLERHGLGERDVEGGISWPHVSSSAAFKVAFKVAFALIDDPKLLLNWNSNRRPADDDKHAEVLPNSAGKDAHAASTDSQEVSLDDAPSEYSHSSSPQAVDTLKSKHVSALLPVSGKMAWCILTG